QSSRVEAAEGSGFAVHAGLLGCSAKTLARKPRPAYGALASIAAYRAMFAAVIFDCDGCLIDSEVLALEVELEAVGEGGLVYDRAEFCRRFMGLSNPVFFAALDDDRRAHCGEPLPPDLRDLH